MTKYILTISIIWGVLTLFSCEKQDDSDPIPADPVDSLYFPDMKLNTVSLLQNGSLRVFEKPEVTLNTSKQSVNLQIKTYKGNLLEWLSATRIPLEEGTYTPKGVSFSQTDLIFSIAWALELDQSVGFIHTDTLYTDNKLEVLRFHEKTRILEGRFTVRMVGEVDPTAPPSLNIKDTVLFEQGRFVVKVPE